MWLQVLTTMVRHGTATSVVTNWFDLDNNDVVLTNILVEWTKKDLGEGSQTFTLFLPLCFSSPSFFVSFFFFCVEFPSLSFPSFSFYSFGSFCCWCCTTCVLLFFSFLCVLLLLPCWWMSSMVKFHGIHLSSMTKLHNQTCNAHM